MGINSDSHDSLVLDVPNIGVAQFSIVGIGASADFFFHSLAEKKKDKSIGIILS